MTQDIKLPPLPTDGIQAQGHNGQKVTAYSMELCAQCAKDAADVSLHQCYPAERHNTPEARQHWQRRYDRELLAYLEPHTRPSQDGPQTKIRPSRADTKRRDDDR